MFLFKKSKDKKYAEKLYELIANRTNKYTLEDIKKVILLEGYSENVANLVIKKIKKNKLPIKTDLSKEDIIKQLSKIVKENKSKIKENTENQVPKEDLKQKSFKENKKETKNLDNVSKVSFLTRTKVFFKRIYYFFEDKYYDCIDWVSKYIPLNKLTDNIDKKFPSFVLFLLLIILIFILIFSGVFSFSKSWTLYVEVYDPSNTPLNNVNVILQINDENISTKITDVFGEAIFRDFKSKRQNITLIASKEHYNTNYHNFTINKNNLRQIITLSIDLENPNIPSNPPEERNILFVENDDILINTILNTSFSCTNTEVNPDPRNTIVSNGKVTVLTPRACGALRVSVSSNQFNSITNRVVPEDNKVLLVRKNLDRGTLGVSVKNILNEAIPDAQAVVFYASESNFLALDSITTDMYGLNQFSLEPRQYLVTVSKEGYLTHPRKGPFTVIKDTIVNSNFILFTSQDLTDFDCLQDKYKPFCVNGNIDCENKHLKPFVNLDSQGVCVIGNPGYIDVSLKDLDTQEPVFADIVLDSRLKGSNDEFYSTTVVKNKSHYVFEGIDFYDYRIRVVNSEINGYIQPDPVLVNNLDQNIVINLEFSTELNSGVVKVNVKSNEININNARVYLYREFEDNFILVNEEPRYTNQFGTVDFKMQRANENYQAYSIHSVMNKQGTSNIGFLDVNSVLKLDIELFDIPKILNLKVIPKNYDINFYNSLHQPITEFVTVDLDSNKQYFFTGENINSVYAILSSQGYTTYQTELINLIPNQEVFREINLLNLSSCNENKIELLGFYDSSGSYLIDNIDFIENTLDKSYKLKFKYTSCLEDAEHKKVHIRSGNQIFIDDDVIFLESENITSNDVSFKRGYMFSGEHVPDFNFNLYLEHYHNNHSDDYNGENYKWVEIDFKDLVPEIIEFSVDIGFKITPIKTKENYVVGYRAFETIHNEVYNFDPNIDSSWNEISVYPEGYFFAETHKFEIPFSDDDYLFSRILKDINNNFLEPYADGYKFDIGSEYKQDIEYIYLKEEQTNGLILQDSENTADNLKYLSYGFVSNIANSEGDEDIYTHISINDFNYSLLDINASKGYNIKKNTLFEVLGFFNTNNTPKIKTDVLNNNPLSLKNIYAYNPDSTFLCNIETNAQDNSILIGENDINFTVYNNFGSPVKDVVIKYQISGKDKINLGETNNQGILEITNLTFDIEDLSKNVDFFFIFDSSAGISGNTIKKTKNIKSGVFLFNTPLNYVINYLNLDGNNIYQIVQKIFTIKNTTNLSLSFENLTFNPTQASLFKVSETNDKLLEINDPIPRDLNSLDTNVITDFILSDNLSSNIDTNAFFRNEIKFSDNITQIFEAQTIISLNNLGNLNKFVDYNQPNKGVLYFEEEDFYSIELIKNLNPSISIDFNLSSDMESVTLKNINYSSLPEFIDSSYFEDNLNITEIPLNEPLPISVIFKINDSFNNNFITEEKIVVNGNKFPTEKEEIVVNFILDVNGTEIILKETFKVKAFDLKSIISLEYNIPNNSSLTIFCATQNCLTQKSYTINKHIKNYEVILEKDIGLDPLQDKLYVSNLDSNLIVHEETNNFGVRYFSDFNKLEDDSFSSNTDTVFNFNLFENVNFEIKKPLDYTINKIDWSVFESDLDGDFCIGVGGQVSGNDLFILGYCQEDVEKCYTGSQALPKIFFNWGESSLPESWDSKCIGDNLDDMNAKYACDSLQMLISIFYKIQGGISEPFYIKLLNDGISKELLKDFIDYNPGPFLNIPEPTNQNLFTEDAIENEDFKIVINNDSNLKTFLPGIYEVRVYGEDDNFYNNNITDKKIEINLEFKRSLPTSELTVFHYMPFNAGINNKGSPGYGLVISEGSEIININSDIELDSVFKEDAIATLLITNNNNLSGFNQTINSEGYVLDIKKYPENYIKLEYTPSYPIPLYAHVACHKENSFSYNLFQKNNALDNLIGVDGRFLKWKFNDSYLLDLLFSNIQGNRFVLNTNQISENNLNINTMLYLPITNEVPLNSLTFKTSNFENNENTKIFSKNDLTGAQDILFNDQLHVLGSDLEYLKTIKGIFEYIKQDKACIFKSPSRTYIKWVDESVNFTEDEIITIQSNIPEHSCQEIEKK